MFRFLKVLPLALLIVFPLQAATIGDRVWIDENRNGVQDPGEKPKAGIGLKLYFDKNGDGFPERLIARASSDTDGKYAFNDVGPGLYSVGLEVNSLPEDIYETTRLHVGERRDRDNDLNRNTLRTQPFEVRAGDRLLTDVADIGLVVGSAKVEYKGKENYVSLTGLQVECDVYTYQGLKLRFPVHHGRLKPEVIKQWMQWLKLTDSIQQQLMVHEAFLDGGLARELGAGNMDNTVGYRPLAYAGGTYASQPRSEGDDVGKVLLDDPGDFHRHWTLIYEMGRVHPGPWHFRATWPPYTFMNAHFQTAVVLYELGGEAAMKKPNPYNGLAYESNLTGLAFWEKGDFKYAEVFQPDFNDRGVWLEHDNGDRHYFWGGTISMMLLFHIYQEEGFEKLVEVYQNMARKPRLVSTAAQAGIELSEAINDATDGKYARKLIEEWGMPDPGKYAFKTIGKDTGPFVDKEEYRWDFIPFNSEDVAEGYAPLTQHSMKGYVRWTEAPGWATRSWDGALGQSSGRDQTIVGMGYNFQDVGGPNSFGEYLSFLERKPKPTVKEARKIGGLSAEETDNAKDYYISRWLGKLYVPKTAEYTFKLASDDWSKLVINGSLVGSNYSKGGVFTVRLPKGWHDFELGFGEIGGAAWLKFDYDPALEFLGPDSSEVNRDALPMYERYDNVTLEGWTPIEEDAFTLRHELSPGVWDVTVVFSNTVETRGVYIAAEGKMVKSGINLPRHQPHEETFQVKVHDGALELSFWNESSAFNSIGLSSLRIKKVRD
ncbi:MAG: SdrD B-like domain-containing protein [Planctomycetota bacterium]